MVGRAFNPRASDNTSLSDNLPKLAPLLIAQGAMFAVACAFQTFGIVAAVTVGSRSAYQLPVTLTVWLFSNDFAWSRYMRSCVH